MSLDYVLVLGIMLPAMGFVMWAAPRLIRLFYETSSVMISWPFM